MSAPTKSGMAAAAALLLSLAAVAPTSAAIQCKGPYQVTSHGLLSTPYCEDTYLAQVANMDPRVVRQNPNAKDVACQLVGHMPRVSHICRGLGNEVFKR